MSSGQVWPPAGLSSLGLVLAQRKALKCPSEFKQLKLNKLKSVDRFFCQRLFYASIFVRTEVILLVILLVIFQDICGNLGIGDQFIDVIQTVKLVEVAADRHF